MNQDVVARTPEARAVWEALRAIEPRKPDRAQNLVRTILQLDGNEQITKVAKIDKPRVGYAMEPKVTESTLNKTLLPLMFEVFRVEQTGLGQGDKWKRLAERCVELYELEPEDSQPVTDTQVPEVPRAENSKGELLRAYSAPRSTRDEVAAAEARYLQDKALRLHLPLACTFYLEGATGDPVVRVKGVTPAKKFMEELEYADPSHVRDILERLFAELGESPDQIAGIDRKLRIQSYDEWTPDCVATEAVQAAWLAEPISASKRKTFRRELARQFGVRAQDSGLLAVCYVSRVHSNTFRVSCPLWDQFLTAFMRQIHRTDPPLADLERSARWKMEPELEARALAHQTHIIWSKDEYARVGLLIDPADSEAAPGYFLGDASVWSMPDKSFHLGWALHDWTKGLPPDYDEVMQGLEI